MPVFDIWIANYRLALVYGLDGLSYFLIKALAVDHHKRLTSRMRMPITTCPRLECHTCEPVLIAAGFLCKHLQPHRASKPIGRGSFTSREYSIPSFIFHISSSS